MPASRSRATVRRAAMALSEVLPVGRAAAALGVRVEALWQWRSEAGLPQARRGSPDREWWCPDCGASMTAPGFCSVECRESYTDEFEEATT